MKRSFSDSTDRPNLKNTVQYPITQLDSRQHMGQNRQVIIGSQDTHRNGKYDVYSMYYPHEFLMMLNNFKTKINDKTYNTDVHIYEHIREFFDKDKGEKYLLQPSVIEKIERDVFLRPLISLSIELIKQFYFDAGILLAHDHFCFTLQHAGIANTFNYWGNIVQGQYLFLLLKEQNTAGQSWNYVWEPIKTNEKYTNKNYINKDGIMKEGLLIYVGQATKSVSYNYSNALTSNKILGNTGASTVDIFGLINEHQELELKVKMERYNF